MAVRSAPKLTKPSSLAHARTSPPDRGSIDISVAAKGPPDSIEQDARSLRPIYVLVPFKVFHTDQLPLDKQLHPVNSAVGCGDALVNRRHWCLSRPRSKQRRVKIVPPYETGHCLLDLRAMRQGRCLPGTALSLFLSALNRYNKPGWAIPNCGSEPARL